MPENKPIDTGLLSESGGANVLGLFAIFAVGGGIVSTLLNLSNDVPLTGGAQLISLAGLLTLWLLQALKQVAKDPEWIAGMTSRGAIPAIGTSKDTEKFVKEQFERYERLVPTLGLRQ